ncbi:nitroreductase family protein [Serratia plymuthica]|uniref:nitroreductase family protein n=2 Tax=Serratia plymuthica TaxID=82996 RepID=UPI0004565C22|nr:hypothetical protein sch_13355 [Serratia plymuthica]
MASRCLLNKGPRMPGWYQDQPLAPNDLILQRDEVVRSASLAAMTLMLAAQGMGLGSCPMVGFNPQEPGGQ